MFEAYKKLQLMLYYNMSYESHCLREEIDFTPLTLEHVNINKIAKNISKYEGWEWKTMKIALLNSIDN